MFKKIIKKIINIFRFKISKINNKYKKLSFYGIHKIKINIERPIFFDLGTNQGQPIRRFKKIF